MAYADGPFACHGFSVERQWARATHSLKESRHGHPLATDRRCVVHASGRSLTHADIYRWDTGEVIPGTEGIEPGPGVQLDHCEPGGGRFGGSRI